MKEVSGVIASILTFALFIPYVRSIRAGSTRPHVFSWLIWGAGTCAVAMAQLSAGAEWGGWVILGSGIFSIYISYLALKYRGKRDLRPVDWLFLFMGMAALPAWAVTNEPMWAVALLTAADLLGFGPTVRKALRHPHDEPVWFYLLAALRNLLVLFALGSYSLTTVIFPLAIGLACLTMAIMLTLLRRSVPREVEAHH
jgi:hypothetical protein